jgi:hypothetical protein
VDGRGGQSSAIHQSLEIVAGRKWTGLAIFLCVFVPALSVGNALPYVYRASTTVLSPEGLADRMRRDIALDLKGVERTWDRGATVAFALGYRGRDPGKVAEVASALAALYVSRNEESREQQATRTAEFLKSGLDDVKKLEAQEDRIGQYKRRHSGELPQDVEANMTVLSRLNAQLETNAEKQTRAQERRDRLADTLPEVQARARGGGPGAVAELPRASVDTSWPVSTGRTLAVAAGGDVQDAIDRAAPGDVVTLQAGAVFRGPFTLPRKEGDGWIVIRTSTGDADLPRPGTRMRPEDARLMPALEASSGAVLRTEPGAHHYRLVGIEMRPAQGAFLYGLVVLGNGETLAGRLPHHLVIDRCYLHGDPRKGTRRGIALNSKDTAVIDSWLSDFKEAGADSQAIGSWNGTGPFKIANNHLEGAGENVIFGGSPPSILDLVPSDIEVVDNDLYKPPVWKEGDPSYEGTHWSVKNTFELKNARRVVVRRNVLENNWPDGQNGFAILFTVRTEGDRAPWAVVQDVTFADNVVRHTASGFNILGIDDTSPGGAGRTARLLIANNLFLDVGTPGAEGTGVLFQILNGASDVTIEHNTALHTGSIIVGDMRPSPGLVFRDNIVEHNAYGVFGGGLGSGLPALEHFFPGFAFIHNVIVGTPDPKRYPPDNLYPRILAGVGFVDGARGDYRLAATSPFHRKGTGGADPGVDFDRLPKR